MLLAPRYVARIARQPQHFPINSPGRIIGIATPPYGCTHSRNAPHSLRICTYFHAPPRICNAALHSPHLFRFGLRAALTASITHYCIALHYGSRSGIAVQRAGPPHSGAQPGSWPTIPARRTFSTSGTPSGIAAFALTGSPHSFSAPPPHCRYRTFHRRVVYRLLDAGRARTGAVSRARRSRARTEKQKKIQPSPRPPLRITPACRAAWPAPRHARSPPKAACALRTPLRATPGLARPGPHIASARQATDAQAGRPPRHTGSCIAPGRPRRRLRRASNIRTRFAATLLRIGSRRSAIAPHIRQHSVPSIIPRRGCARHYFIPQYNR